MLPKSTKPHTEDTLYIVAALAKGKPPTHPESPWPNAGWVFLLSLDLSPNPLLQHKTQPISPQQKKLHVDDLSKRPLPIEKARTLYEKPGSRSNRITADIGGECEKENGRKEWDRARFYRRWRRWSGDIGQRGSLRRDPWTVI
ncbi:hypothetical protein HO173_001359 [Letharia columbiana]|uniref:Uncharacterized protein n=1 Tax=Letharia columbiana TaxID=112416 RepID=A0A8H6G546_9LECA|nr:uncharacterized protein HO173_001359 [Letharia columbiana]KAF6240687.1 hypothetical protein HO173_001359 [Letharia columbiana]